MEYGKNRCYFVIQMREKDILYAWNGKFEWKKKIETKRNLLHFFQKFFFLFHSDIYKSIEKDILDIPIGFLIIQKTFLCL